MEYISHEDYKKMLGSFGKEVPKRTLTEGLEQEGNAFTAGLAKTKRGGEFKVGNKSFKDRTNYDAPVNEYQFDQMYPDDPGPFENDNSGYKDDRYNSLVSTNRGEDKDFAKLSRDEKEKMMSADTDSDLANLDPNEVGGLGPSENSRKFASFSDDHGWYDDKDRQHKDFDFDYDEEEYNDLPSLHAKHGDTNWFAKGPQGEKFFNRYKDMYGGPLKVRIRKEDNVDGMIREFLMKEDDVNWDRMDNEEAEENETDNGIEEDINLPSSQPTGPSIEETRRPLSHLSPEERDQLRQYVETIRTVKEQINKMVNKSGMEEGGDMTGLVMRPTTNNGIAR
jgi:hypothetical protein